jgi:hypothetical protein
MVALTHLLKPFDDPVRAPDRELHTGEASVTCRLVFDTMFHFPTHDFRSRGFTCICNDDY